MTEMTDAQQRRPGRPRSPQTEQAILDAALQLLAEEGVQGMSVEGVAARAGVGKTTIYRRWPNKDALILDALRLLKPPIIEFDTGDLRSDITAYLRYISGLLNDPTIQRLSLRILGEMAGRPSWSTNYFLESVRPNLDGLQGMIERARVRGELRPDVDPVVVMDLIGGPIFFHFIFSLFMPGEGPFDIERHVALLWEGLRPYRANAAHEART